jgi:hypothetical protein
MPDGNLLASRPIWLLGVAANVAAARRLIGAVCRSATVYWLLLGAGTLATLGVASRLVQIRVVKHARTAFIIDARDGDLEEVRSALAWSLGAHLPYLLEPEPDWQGVTALYAAALHGHADVVRLLLAHHAAVDDANDLGDTPLCVAAQEGHCACITELLAAGAAMNRQSAPSHATALMYACAHGHERAVALLLLRGAATDLANADGNSALFLSCEKGHVECARLLLEAGVSHEGPRTHSLSPCPVERDGRSNPSPVPVRC